MQRNVFILCNLTRLGVHVSSIGFADCGLREISNRGDRSGFDACFGIGVDGVALVWILGFRGSAFG